MASEICCVNDAKLRGALIEKFIEVAKVQYLCLYYHQYGRYWYNVIGMARVPHMRNTNMHGENSAKTERLAVKRCYYYYSAISLSNKPKYMAGNHH